MILDAAWDFEPFATIFDEASVYEVLPAPNDKTQWLKVPSAIRAAGRSFPV
jgi:hypothetical protein